MITNHPSFFYLLRWEPSGMMEAVHVSETSIHFETTQRYIPEECHLHTCCCENLNPHNFHNIYIWCAVLSLVILLFHSVNIALLSSTIYDICTWYCIITYPFLHTHKMLVFICHNIWLYMFMIPASIFSHNFYCPSWQTLPGINILEDAGDRFLWNMVSMDNIVWHHKTDDHPETYAVILEG
jgi:hypothetical protein